MGYTLELLDKSEITQQLVGWSLSSPATRELHSGNEGTQPTGSGHSLHHLCSVAQESFRDMLDKAVLHAKGVPGNVPEPGEQL